jgi:hypothetical protein
MTNPIRDIPRFQEVFHAEFKELRKRRARSMLDVVPADVPHPVPSVAHGFTGIALSGGGVRSAVFSLGVLQGLQSKWVVDCADYLSTVSGGGYIGTALTLGMSTNGGVFPFSRNAEDPGETPEVQHLRDNSRYLLQNGVSSAISALAIYLRGIVMNLIIVLPFLLLSSAALIVVYPDTAHLSSNNFFVEGLSKIPSFAGLGEIVSNFALPLTLIGAGIVLVLLAVYAVFVSIFPILPLEKRRFWARIAAVILGLYGLTFIAELHPWLLRAAFIYEGMIPVQPETGSQVLTPQFANWLFAIVKNIVIWVGPLVVAVLPFIKELAGKASEDAAGGWIEFAKRLASRAVLIFAAAIVPLTLWVIMMQLAYWGTAVSVCSDPNQLIQECNPYRVIDNWKHAPSLLQSLLGLKDPVGQPNLNRFHVSGWYFSLAVPTLVFAWLVFNVNANSLHQLYRDRLGSAFLVKRPHPGSHKVEPADLFKLTDMNTQAPYHLINTALNVPGSTFANARGRNADFFLFSRCFVGSEATGYAPTALVEKVTDGLNIGTAMAISGAAAAPNMGVASMRPLSPTIAFLNVRLGRWLRHPVDIVDWAKSTTRKPTDKPSWFGRPGPLYLLCEAFFKSGREVTKTEGHRLPHGFVFLTDGGHVENLGVYELLRRRCALIIAVDGEADPDLDGGSLVQLERFARIDLDIQIDMGWKSIATRTRAVGEEVKKKIVNPSPGPHVALGLISYPSLYDGGPREKGVLVYIKASLSGDENDYIMAYKAAHASFPHETTLDQFFSEEQVEVYRALGEHIARRFLDGSDPTAAAFAHRAELLDMVRAAIPGATPV